MKKALTIFLIFLLATNTNAQITSGKTEKTEKKILELVLETLKKEHISPRKLDDTFSKEMFKTYIDSLDKFKLFFLKSDIDEFKNYENKLDELITKSDPFFFDLTYDRYILRMKESQIIYKSILNNKFDFSFTDDAIYSFSYKKNNLKLLNSSLNKNDQNIKWSNALKTLIVDLSVNQYINQSPITLNLESILEKNQMSFNEYIESSLFNHVNIDREKIFKETFIGSFLKCIISDYNLYSTKVIKNRKKLFLGIYIGTGVVFEQGIDFVKVKRLSLGSESEKNGKIEAGDAILKIQLEGQESVSVIGMNLNEVAKLEKGGLGSVIIYTLKKPNGTIVEVPIKRGIISMNDPFIKSSVVLKNKISFGFIAFSNFYNDLQNEKISKNLKEDLALELENLKKENVSGLILDLRGNTGEFLKSAIDILANFLVNTPITIVKASNNPEILKTETTTKNWEKPIVILVNHKTAAAAELIANTFKDYNLGIVIGELTHGKNSIEKFQDLNELVTNKEEFNDLGVLSFSNQKFYNLNGKSVQKKGVMPDVVFRTDNTLDREANYPQSLAPDAVKPIPFTPINPKGYFATIIKKSQDRLAKSENFKRINAQIAEDKRFENELANIKTLNLEKLNTQINALLASEKTIEAPVYDKNRIFTLPSASIKALKKEEYLISKRNQWLESLKTDFQIDEGINILEDMLLLEKK